MKISEMSRSTGVDVETLRFWEKAGLLAAPPRQANGYRHYGPAELERVAFVRHCRALDMPLPDVRQLLQVLDGGDTDAGQTDALVARHLLQVRARLASLQALERQLSALQSRCDADHAAHECGVLHELVAAAHGEACACHEDGGAA